MLNRWSWPSPTASASMPKEAGFLRVMARYCIDNRMPGWGACENLIKALDAALIPEWSSEPTGWYFEERGP